MNQTFIFIIIGVTLVALIAVVFRSQEVLGARHSSGPQDTSNAPRFANRQAEILMRIVEPDDWNFVLERGSQHVQHLFCVERRTIAFRWLSEVRDQARAVIRLHVTQARQSEKLLVSQELRLAIEFAAIEMRSALLGLALYLGGPLALRRIPHTASRLAKDLKTLVELTLKPVSEIPGNSG